MVDLFSPTEIRDLIESATVASMNAADAKSRRSERVALEYSKGLFDAFKAVEVDTGHLGWYDVVSILLKTALFVQLTRCNSSTMEPE
jgi:hypothetical protein